MSALQVTIEAQHAFEAARAAFGEAVAEAAAQLGLQQQASETPAAAARMARQLRPAHLAARRLAQQTLPLQLHAGCQPLDSVSRCSCAAGSRC